MYDIKWIRENAEAFDQGRQTAGPRTARRDASRARRQTPRGDRQIASRARAAQCRIEGNRRRDEGGRCLPRRGVEGGSRGIERRRLRLLRAEEREAIAALDKALAEIPNTPLDDVPDGRDENDNVELRRVGEPRALDFQPKEHFDIGEALGLMDFETADKNFRRALCREQGCARAAGARAWRNSCSICIRASMAIWK